MYRFYRIYSSLFGLFLAGTTQISLGTPLPPIREIFIDMPAETILSDKTGKPLTKDERARLITLEDQKNLYLEVTGNDGTGNFCGAQMTVFKTKSGGHLIGWRVEKCNSTSEHIQMFSKKGATWTDVTTQVMPALTKDIVDQRVWKKIPSMKKKGEKLSNCASGTYNYKLPRRGTTVEIFVSSDCYNLPRLTLWNLKFDGERFKLGD